MPLTPYEYSKNLHLNTAKDLIRKNLVSEKFKQIMLQPTWLNASIANYVLEGMPEYTCKKCKITIRASRKWIVNHHQWHADKFRESKERENEILKSDFEVY